MNCELFHIFSPCSHLDIFAELSLEAQEARSEVQKLYDQPMNKWGIEEVVIFFQHKLHMSEKVVAKAKENIKSGEVSSNKYYSSAWEVHQ